jgi:L-aspartate oxidase
MTRKYDFLIIGGGVAGMSFALKVARSGQYKIALCCKTTLEEANTAKAQGGIASVTNLLVDDFDKHIHDTMVAGDWLSDPAAVEQVVRNAPKGIEELVQWGVQFDKKEDGQFDLHREGGHSEFRILHHADDTGAEIQRGLMEAVRRNPYIDVLENHFAVDARPLNSRVKYLCLFLLLAWIGGYVIAEVIDKRKAIAEWLKA